MVTSIGISISQGIALLLDGLLVENPKIKPMITGGIPMTNRKTMLGFHGVSWDLKVLYGSQDGIDWDIPSSNLMY